MNEETARAEHIKGLLSAADWILKDAQVSIRNTSHLFQKANYINLMLDDCIALARRVSNIVGESLEAK